MTNLLHGPARSRGFAVAASLIAVLGIGTTQAADTASPPAIETPIEELVELDEIRVRGRLVANTVITAENRLFRLYNKLNRNNRFDVHCADMRLDWDSLALQRTCLPEFLGRYMPAPTPSASYYMPPPPFSHDTSAPVVCGADSCYSPSSFSSPAYSYRPVSMASFSALPASSIPVSIPVVLPEAERTAYSENVLRVIRSDPELLDLATKLVGMYREMDRVQGHYVKVRQERREARAAKKAAARERARELGLQPRQTNPRTL